MQDGPRFKSHYKTGECIYSSVFHHNDDIKRENGKGTASMRQGFSSTNRVQTWQRWCIVGGKYQLPRSVCCTKANRLTGQVNKLAYHYDSDWYLPSQLHGVQYKCLSWKVSLLYYWLGWLSIASINTCLIKRLNWFRIWHRKMACFVSICLYNYISIFF